MSEPAPQAGTAKVVLAETAPAEQPAAETVSIDDDATPMVARVGGAEAIAEEDVPMGAFDAPVDPGSLGRGSGGYWNGTVGRCRRAPAPRDGAAAGHIRKPGAGQ